MQFVLIGRDGNDEGALDRRLKARDAHLKHVKASRDSGMVIFAIALKENDKPVGSIIAFECQSRSDVDSWLESEPYILGNVWKSTEISEASLPVLE